MLLGIDTKLLELLERRACTGQVSALVTHLKIMPGCRMQILLYFSNIYIHLSQNVFK
jgi:hypothetical protein